MSNTSPKDQAALFFNAGRRRPARRAPTAGELLFEVSRGADVIRCELRDSEHGVDAQLLVNGELWRSRFFGAWLSQTQTPRALAAQWADTQRARLNAGIP